MECRKDLDLGLMIGALSWWLLKVCFYLLKNHEKMTGDILGNFA